MKPDLTDAELEELDALLARTPEPLQALNVVMLDGYLCGVIVQPMLIDEAQWLPPVFDLDSRPLPADVDVAWLARCRTLIKRRFESLNGTLAEDAWFEPLIAMPEDGASTDPDLAALPAVSQPLLPWAAGFQHAMLCFPAFCDIDDETIDILLERICRHLPPENALQRAALAQLETEQPLASTDDAIDDLVRAVAEMWDLTSEQRYAVQPVRRAVPKVGRNDPCPCGSGRKYKLCHGA
jgi:uncharacterized protein